MAENTSYFTRKDMDSIYKRVHRYFAEDSKKTIEQQLATYRRRITVIINAIQLEQKTHISKKTGKLKKDGWTISGVGQDAQKKYRKQKLLAEGYLLIQEFRAFLIGESLNYRYYYTTPEGMAKVVQFDESQLLNYIKLTDTKIVMASTTLQKISEDETYQQYLNFHYQNLMNGFKESNTKGLVTVTQNIYNRYAGQNPGLTQKSRPDSWQVFTQGHIMEAMDKTIYKMYESQLNQEEQEFVAEDLFYGQFLGYDNVSGFKGGDNYYTNTQIKANQADLMDYATIIKVLTEIRDLLMTKDLASIEMRIKELFFDAEQESTIRDVNKSVEKAVNQLLKGIPKNI